MATGKRDAREHIEDLAALEERALARLQVTPQEIEMFEAGAAIAGPRALRALVAWHRCKVLRELLTLLGAPVAAAMNPPRVSPPPAPLRRDPHAEPDKTEPRAMILDLVVDEPSGC